MVSSFVVAGMVVSFTFLHFLSPPGAPLCLQGIKGPPTLRRVYPIYPARQLNPLIVGWVELHEHSVPVVLLYSITATLSPPVRPGSLCESTKGNM